MSDQSNHNSESSNPEEQRKDPQRPLSEIGHLFLSSIRDRQTNGANRPVRRPPGGTSNNSQNELPKPVMPDHSIDLTPEEFAQVYGGGESAAKEEARPDVTAVIAAHLNGRQIDRVREYAAHIASTSGRVGLIEVDASEFRLMLFERRSEGASDAVETASVAPERLDPRRMTEALEELNWDVDKWLLLLPNPRTNEARALLREVSHWTLLATCDHDGTVSAYRTLKGLADLRSYEAGKPATVHPTLSLALLDVRSHDEADRMTLKLAGVCQQFLNWNIESESLVKPAVQVSDHLVLCCRAGKDGTGGNAPQFKVVRDFLTRSEEPATMDIPIPEPVESVATVEHTEPAPAPESVSNMVSPNMPVAESAVPFMSAPTAEMKMPEMKLAMTESFTPSSDVIDLVGDDTNPSAVVSAVLRSSTILAETPLKAPTCPSASLAVSRDRKLVLVAVARQGLQDLRAIAQAYRWMTDNRPLIAMALPQFAIEPGQSPRLQLLVSQADVSAEMLQPLLQSGNVTVQTYRKLRWGGKTGLLLEAA
jgi:hypothetical protein